MTRHHLNCLSALLSSFPESYWEVTFCASGLLSPDPRPVEPGGEQEEVRHHVGQGMGKECGWQQDEGTWRRTQEPGTRGIGWGKAGPLPKAV